MVEEQKTRIDNALTSLLEDIDKSFIRTLQGKMYKCAATCCEDKYSSMHGVQRCIETCAQPLEGAQNFLQNEVSHFQGRLQRCVMSCNDTIRDKMGLNTNEADVKKYTREFESCAKKCVDTHIDLLPDLLKKIKEVMKKENN